MSTISQAGRCGCWRVRCIQGRVKGGGEDEKGELWENHRLPGVERKGPEVLRTAEKEIFQHGFYSGQ